MKILSLSREYTESENEIAFNLDGTITAELMALMHCANLTLTPRGNVLVVRKDVGGEAFTHDFVVTLQQKLDDAQRSLRDAASQRLRTQASMARQLNLPLG